MLRGVYDMTFKMLDVYKCQKCDNEVKVYG
jgi:hypothetical protein